MAELSETVTRVVLEYEDRSKELTGKEAQEWLDVVNGMCANLENRGQNPFASRKFNWKDIPSTP